MRCKSSYLIKYSLIVAPVVKLVDTADFSVNLSLQEETPEVNPVKLGEIPG